MFVKFFPFVLLDRLICYACFVRSICLLFTALLPLIPGVVVAVVSIADVAVPGPAAANALSR